MNKKKKMIIMLIAIAFILIGGGITTILLVMRYNTIQHENYVNTSLQNIDNWNAQFHEATTLERRNELYHNLNSAQIEYISGDSSNNDEIIARFEITLSTMKEYFFEYFYAKISEIERADPPEQLYEIVLVIDDYINRLNLIKAEISDSGVFTNDTTRLNQLNDKATSLLGQFEEKNEWLSSINELNERFIIADRDEKFVVFNEFLRLQEDFDSSDYESDLIYTVLGEIISEKRIWFHDWYTDEITSLGQTIRTQQGVINALMQLNDLAEIFSAESKVLFTPDVITALNSSFDEAISNNLSALEKMGIARIYEENFRSEAAEKAIEYFIESFIEWKEDHRDYEHLVTFDELVQEAIELGQHEHIASLRSETARRTRIGFT